MARVRRLRVGSGGSQGSGGNERNDGRSERVADTDLVLDPKREWIKERIELGWSPQTVFEELPLSVPRSNFYRYLHRHHLRLNARAKNIMELIHEPGECLQVDWGKLFDVADARTGKKKTVWIFNYVVWR